MSKRKKVTSVIAAAAIAASMAPSVSAEKVYYDENGNAIYDTYDYDYDYDYDRDYYNGNRVNNRNMDPHINIDISDPAAYQRYLHDHMENCDERYQHYDENGNIINHGAMQYDWEVYNQNQGFNQAVQQPVQNEQTSTVLYTVVKTQGDVTKYAYSPVADVAKAYGINGWTVNSIYNENDYELNSVFYEEINTFGNDIRWNHEVRNKIDNAHNLYIWTYPTESGVGYCVSPVKFPQINGFLYNSDFNMNDVNVELKTAFTIINTPMVEAAKRVYTPQH